MGASHSRSVRALAAMSLLPCHHAAAVRSVRSLASRQLAAATLRPAVLRSTGRQAISLCAVPVPGSSSSATAPHFGGRSPPVRAFSLAHAPSVEKTVAEPMRAEAQRLPVRDAEVHMVLDCESARRAVEVLAQHNHLVHACDTEVAGLDLSKSPLGQGTVICVSVYSGPEIDFGSGPGRALWVDTTAEGVLDELRGWLEDERALKVWHNYGFDRHVLYNHDIDVRGFGGDTMHMARLWDASRLAGYSLEALTNELLGRRKAPIPQSPAQPPCLPMCETPFCGDERVPVAERTAAGRRCR